MNFFIFIFMFIGIVPALGETLLTTGDGIKSLQQQVEILNEYRQSQNKELSVLAFDWLSQLKVSEEEITAISRLIKQGESLFFANDFAQSEIVLAQAAERLMKIPIRGYLKTILVKILMRLAQVELVLNKKSWESRFQTILNLEPTIKFSSTDYPTGFIKKWINFKNQNQTERYPLSVELPVNGLVFIDGVKKITQEKVTTFAIRTGLHHLAVLLPGANWWIKTFHANSPLKIEVNGVPLVTGTCHAPEYNGPPLENQLKLVAQFSKDCRRSYQNGLWNMLLAPTNPTPWQAQLSEPLEKPSWFSDAISSPWFWIGTAVVVGGVVYYSQSQEESPARRRVPTHTGLIGF